MIGVTFQKKKLEGASTMNSKQILNELEQFADPKRKENLVKLGIPVENSMGVSTGDIRNIAKNIAQNDMLAMDLWQTDIHDAKLLAVLLLNPQNATDEQIDDFMQGIHSWDLCDHFCKNYLLKVHHYQKYIHKWVVTNDLYYKRAAFTLIASQAIRDKKIEQQTLETYLTYIELHSDEERIHIYKAISWALREIGKIDLTLQEQAIICAYNLLESDNKNKQRIAKLSLKELESLIHVPGRKRLISNKSTMATT